MLAPESKWWFSAFVDFTFNLGAGRLQMSMLQPRVNQRYGLAASQEGCRWV
ncbi:TPA: glycoside hydrolase family protein [Pseudomonas aeruginosa]|uniref:glycoside hydrolase family protein n=1 Tax=Pseudomonas TaxID=286 RepID=UPI0035235BFA